MPESVFEFWKVQNTGYSAGVSWFDCRGPQTDTFRFKSEKEARQYLVANRWGGADVLWRLVHTIIATTETERVTTERFFPVRSRQRKKF
jgi:hypothetical protein